MAHQAGHMQINFEVHYIHNKFQQVFSPSLPKITKATLQAFSTCFGTSEAEADAMVPAGSSSVREERSGTLSEIPRRGA